MKINYRVLAYSEADHSILVRYFTDTLTEEMLANQLNADGSVLMREEGWPQRCRTDYNITLFNKNSPTDDELLEVIKNNAPALWFKTLENVENPEVVTSLDSVKPLVGKANSFTHEFVEPQLPPEVVRPDIVEGGEVTLQSVMNTLNAILASSNSANKVVLVTE